MRVQAELVTSKEELHQILDLQQRNLKRNIDDAEMNSQGFVTMEHTFDVLQQMHDLAPSIIIKDGDKVAGYALTMLRACRAMVPDLDPMFANFDILTWNSKPMNEYSFYAMGQICIGKEYRGKGLFEELYNGHKKFYGDKYDFIITEVSTTNYRSLRAHEKVGFKTVHTYRDAIDEWAVVLWDWQ